MAIDQANVAGVGGGSGRATRGAQASPSACTTTVRSTTPSHGVTSVENPLPVDEHTLFQFGSTGKTFTATAIMRLVDQGRVDLDATVRTYLPELTLSDESVAGAVTVLQLLNHTAGWSGDVFDNTGDGDDALARYVELMADRRAGHAARLDRVVQQRLAVDRRQDHREGHRQDVRAGDPRAASSSRSASTTATSSPTRS